MKDSETPATSGGISVRAFCKTGNLRWNIQRPQEMSIESHADRDCLQLLAAYVFTREERDASCLNL
jgi:hypothetical protein